MWDAGQARVVDTIQGSSFLAVQAAMKAAQRHHLDSLNCKILVMRDDVSVVVVFGESDRLDRAEGDLGVRQETDKELSPSELRALLSATGQVELLDTIQCSSVPPIEAALPVFQRYNPDLKRYRISVVREKESIAVTFTDRGTQPGGRGHAGPMLGFEVELNARDLHVLRSNFIR